MPTRVASSFRKLIRSDHRQVIKTVVRLLACSRYCDRAAADQFDWQENVSISGSDSAERTVRELAVRDWLQVFIDCLPYTFLSRTRTYRPQPCAAAAAAAVVIDGVRTKPSHSCSCQCERVDRRNRSLMPV